MTDRITELRALIAAAQAAHDACRTRSDVPLRERLAIRDDAANAMYAAMERDMPALLDCAEALQGLVAYARDSQGIVGYHMNGAILEWDDVEELHAGMNALARLNGDDPD